MSSNMVSKNAFIFFYICVVSLKTFQNFLIFSHRLNIAIVKALVAQKERELEIKDALVMEEMYCADRIAIVALVANLVRTR